MFLFNFALMNFQRRFCSCECDLELLMFCSCKCELWMQLAVGNATVVNAMQLWMWFGEVKATVVKCLPIWLSCELLQLWMLSVVYQLWMSVSMLQRVVNAFVPCWSNALKLWIWVVNAICSCECCSCEWNGDVNVISRR